MTAKVTIKSEQIDRALQIPLTSIFRIEGETFCLVGNEFRRNATSFNRDWFSQYDNGSCK